MKIIYEIIDATKLSMQGTVISKSIRIQLIFIIGNQITTYYKIILNFTDIILMIRFCFIKKFY